MPGTVFKYIHAYRRRKHSNPSLTLAPRRVPSTHNLTKEQLNAILGMPLRGSGVWYSTTSLPYPFLFLQPWSNREGGGEFISLHTEVVFAIHRYE